MHRLSDVRRETTPPDGVQWHPFSEILPWIEGADRDELKADIERNGIIEPVVFLNGAILDGRNRYTIARECGIEYPRAEYIGDDPLQFVISRNLHRRHLSASQRAMIAAKIANLAVGSNQHVLRVKRDLATGEEFSPPLQVAASSLQIDRKTAQHGRKVVSEGAPELVAAVEHGEASVSAAAEVASLPKDEQAAIVAKGEDEIVAQAKAIKEKRKAERKAERAEPTVKLTDLPPAVQAMEAAKAERRTEAKAQTKPADVSAMQAEIDELREALAAVETENVALKQDIRRFEDMRVQWEQGGFEAVIAGKDEEIRVLKTRVERESGDKAAWARSAKAGWKAAREHGYTRDIIIDLSTGQERV